MQSKNMSRMLQSPMRCAGTDHTLETDSPLESWQAGSWRTRPSAGLPAWGWSRTPSTPSGKQRAREIHSQILLKRSKVQGSDQMTDFQLTFPLLTTRSDQGHVIMSEADCLGDLQVPGSESAGSRCGRPVRAFLPGTRLALGPLRAAITGGPAEPHPASQSLHTCSVTAES